MSAGYAVAVITREMGHANSLGKILSRVEAALLSIRLVYENGIKRFANDPTHCTTDDMP